MSNAELTGHFDTTEFTLNISFLSVYIVWLAVSCSLCKYSPAVTSEEMRSDECVL